MRRAMLLVLLLAVGPAAAQDRAELKKEYDARLRDLAGETDAGRWVQLGDWCRESRLTDEAKSAYKKAEQLSPENEGAVEGMKALGYVLEKRVWIPARDAFARRLRAARGDIEARCELALWARGYGVEKEARAELESICKERPLHRGARLALGFKELHARFWTEAELAREQKVDAAFEEGLSAGLAAEELHKKAKAAGFPESLRDAQRALEWSKNPPGTERDRKITFEGRPYEYTYGVPDSYRPWRAVPLVVNLHGGGDGVGDGDDYFPAVWPLCKERGFICACPTALEITRAMWGKDRDVAYIRAVVDEIRKRYNVDGERTYLMGQSRGSYGCFFIGCQTTDLFAALSPSSCGAGSAPVERLTRTPTLIVHGDKDDRCPVTQSRGDCERMQKLKCPVTYWELPGVGHSLPLDILGKSIDWLSQWTLDPRAKSGR